MLNFRLDPDDVSFLNGTVQCLGKIKDQNGMHLVAVWGRQGLRRSIAAITDQGFETITTAAAAEARLHTDRRVKSENIRLADFSVSAVIHNNGDIIYLSDINRMFSVCTVWPKTDWCAVTRINPLLNSPQIVSILPPDPAEILKSLGLPGDCIEPYAPGLVRIPSVEEAFKIAYPEQSTTAGPQNALTL